MLMETPTAQTEPQINESQTTDRFNWPGAIFLIGLPILTIPLAIWSVQLHGFTLFDGLLMFALWGLGGISITAGYHRYFAHKTYQCSPIVRAFYLAFGGMTVQNSALIWASDHRFHHQFQDTDGDPYSINRGFFWAHMGWMLRANPEARPFSNALDLQKDRAVMWQHRNYALVILVMNFLLPTLIGALVGRPLEGLVWGGLARMFIFHQSTFLVNSAAHTFGRKTFSAKNTARDNELVALLTFGEGHHSFHHAFPTDHRIGYRWFHYDPGKWLIRSLKALGLASDLKLHPKAPA